MTITIELRCPSCNDNNLARNGKKRNGTQNYLCNACGRQFIRDDQRTYIGTLLCVTGLIKIMLARGCGIRDIATILRISVQFFKKAGESYEGVFLGFSLSQLWLALSCHTFCNTSKIFGKRKKTLDTMKLP